MLYLDLFCVSISKMCPKVIASSLYTILAYKRFPGDALLSDSGGNLYFCLTDGETGTWGV